MKKFYKPSVVLLCFLSVIFTCVDTGVAFGDDIIDNGAPGTSFTGVWGVSGATGQYGATSLWSRDGSTYTWTFTPSFTGTYELSMWWTEWPSRSTNVPVDIEFSGGTDTRFVNQQTDGGKWNVIQNYTFIGGQNYHITVTAQPGPSSTSVDAIRFVPLSAPPPSPIGNIVDNGNAGTSFTGTWGISGALNPYGANSVWSRDGATYTWYYTAPQSGTYNVSMWWTTWPSRGTQIPVDISSAGGTTRVFVNQQIGGGQWNPLAVVSFVAGVQYTVTVTSLPEPASTCADAVQFVFADGSVPPPPSGVTAIQSISPDPGVFGAPITLTGQADIAAGVNAFEWSSDRDGVIGNTQVLTTSSLSNGIHTISFRVQDAAGVWSAAAPRTIDVVEHIYVCLVYDAFKDDKQQFVKLMTSMAATKVTDSLYEYRNAATGAKYALHIVQDKPGMINALETEGAHVLVKGHSNYGTGPIFPTALEQQQMLIDNIRYADDDRFLNLGTPTKAVDIAWMRTGQAYPFYWPIFKDGTLALMPYTFGDPRGNPAYNYYISYQVPGEPGVWYKAQTARSGAIERFYDSGSAAWFAANGSQPNPANPNHRKYFIINETPKALSLASSGPWGEDYRLQDKYRENYNYTSAGGSPAEFRWLFTIPVSGVYSVYAWWPTYTGNSPLVPYTVTHAGGSDVLTLNQQINGGKWNKLGDFNYTAGDFSVAVSNNAAPGQVMADGVRVVAQNNPPTVIQANFSAVNRYGAAPLDVDFNSENTGDITGFTWKFGDGKTNSSRNTITHTYTQPGTYTVSLKVNGPAGTNTMTRTGYIVVTDPLAPPEPTPMQAEFSADNQQGSIPVKVKFNDLSSGSVSGWSWNFGDGTTSTLKTPIHTYATPGNYTVSLTVTGGGTAAVSKKNFVIAAIFDASIDNIDYPKPHYRTKNLLYTKALDVPKEAMKYRRLLYDSCNSGNYYLGTFNRGVVFYTLNSSTSLGFLPYIQGYMQGLSDQSLWEIMQAAEPVYDYYNFNKRPQDQ